MKFGEQWLREWVDPPVSTAALAERLTMAGLEVERTAPAAPGLRGVVAARVEAVEKHPNADRLMVCAVKKDAGAPVTVVTGAPGVAAGHCHPYAGVGVALPGQSPLKEAKLRGVKSAGMLCSGVELGLSDDAEGLLPLPADAAPGTELSELLGLEDQVFELGLTPNRGDCLSIAGLAREVAVAYRLPFSPPAVAATPARHEETRAIQLAAPERCPRYAGRLIRQVDLSRLAPLWLRERLRRCGLRSLSPVVDITNYVMLELGQPLHAFDNDRLRGAITVRLAAPGESIVLLDGATRALSESTLVIADEAGPVAMAGVMGGQASAVTPETRHIFLESAFFTPLALAGRPERLGLNTDASHRFERGVDAELQRRALERATELILEVCGGEPGPVAEAVSEANLPARPVAPLRPPAVASLLGKAIDADECVDILTRLGLKEVAGGDGERRFEAPSHRFDLAIEADLIEEIARVHGYQNIASALPPVSLAMRPPGEETRVAALSRALAERGYQEAITYSFVDPALQALLFPEAEGLPLLNAISADLSRMRVSLWPGLLTALRRNLNRQQPRARLFETGKVFNRRDGALAQTPMLGGLSCGGVAPEQWGGGGQAGDFHHLKSDVEAALAASCGPLTPAYRPVAVAALHDGQAAEILLDGRPIGLLGALHPGLQTQLDIDLPVYLFELDLSLIPAKNRVKFSKISKFPIVRRDLSLLVDKTLPVENLLQTIQAAAPEWLTQLALIDVYQGASIEADKKSLTFGLTFQGVAGTLTDGEVEGAMERVFAALCADFQAKLRE